VHLLLVLFEQGLVDLDLRGSKSRGSDEFQSLIPDEFSGQPQERLLEVVVGFGRDVVVLKILLAVECDSLGLDLALLHVDFVATEDNGDVFANTNEIAVPVRNVLVGDAGGHIEHDDAALSIDIISISQSTELLLTCCIPHIELDLSQVRSESQWVDFDAKRGNVLFLEFACQVSLDEGGLSSTTVADKDELEGWGSLSSFGHGADVK